MWSLRNARAVLPVGAIAALLLTHAAYAQVATPPVNEKPSQLARPNGTSAVDPNQSGAPAQSNTTATPAETAPAPLPPGDWTQPLERFSGAFVVRSDDHDARAEVHRNTCRRTGKRFYECEQSEDGEVVSLLIFVPGDSPNHYYTQRVLPSGTAVGRGELAISGERWTFTSVTGQANGAVDHERLTLNFSAKDDDGARYQGERSDDGEHWMTTYSGTEKRDK